MQACSAFPYDYEYTLLGPTNVFGIFSITLYIDAMCPFGHHAMIARARVAPPAPRLMMMSLVASVCSIICQQQQSQPSPSALYHEPATAEPVIAQCSAINAYSKRYTTVKTKYLYWPHHSRRRRSESVESDRPRTQPCHNPSLL